MKIQNAKSWAVFILLGSFALFAGLQGAAQVAQMLAPDAMRQLIHEQWPQITIGVVDALVISPIIETAVLVYVTHIARQAVPNDWIAAVIGAAPVVAIHFLGHPVLAALVSIPFILLAKLWIVLRRENPGRPLFWSFILMHTLCNAITLALASPQR